MPRQHKVRVHGTGSSSSGDRPVESGTADQGEDQGTIKDDTALPMAPPYLNVINQQAKIMLKAAGELGFSPVSRPRIDASPSVFAPAIDIPTDGVRRRQEGRTPTLEEFLASARSHRH